MEMQKLYLLVPLAPLIGAMIAGLFCRVMPRWVAHTATIAGVAIALIASVCGVLPAVAPARRAAALDPAQAIRM